MNNRDKRRALRGHGTGEGEMGQFGKENRDFGNVVLRENGQIVKANQDFYRLLGYSKEEFSQLHGENLLSIVPAGNFRCAWKSIEAQLKTGSHAQECIPFRRKEGGYRWILLYGKREQCGFSCMVFDISDYLALRDKSDETEKLLQGVLTSLPGGIVQLAARRGKLKVEAASTGVYKLSGYTKQQWMEAPIDGEIQNLVLREDRRAFSEALQNRTGMCQGEFRIRRKDGAAAWIQARGRWSGGRYQGVFLDITSQKTTEQELLYQKKRYQTIVNCSSDVIYEYDMAADIMTFYDQEFKDPALRRNGLVVAEYQKKLREGRMVHPDYVDQVMRICRGEKFERMEVRIGVPYRKQGVFYWFEAQGTVIWDSTGERRIAIGVLRNIDEQKRRLQQLKRKSERDALTQLYNRAATQAAIDDYLEGEGREKPAALMVIDIDDFKQVNDRFGHQLGDQALTKVGEILRSVFRSTDFIGRVGGDEFVVFVKDVVDEAIVLEKVERIYTLFHTEVLGGGKAAISSSIGISMYPADGKNYAGLFHVADQAMYIAKRNGKDCYQMAYGRMNCAKQECGSPRDFSKKDCLPSGEVLEKAVYLLSKEQEPADAGYPALLALVGEGFAASRAFLYQMDAQKKGLVCSGEWCAAGVQTAHAGEKMLGIREEGCQQFRGPAGDRLFGWENSPSQTNAMPRACLIAEMPGGAGYLGLEDCNSPRVWTRQELGELSALGRLVALLRKR